MAADAAALVLVLPTDDVESIVEKVRGTGATDVQLLVPDNTAALQALGGFARLRAAVDRDQIGVLVISSDEKTLNAARLNQFDTVGVEGTRVVAPPPTNGQTAANPYETQVLPPASFDPVDPQDAQFLDQLDRVPTGDPFADPLADDADLYAAIDDFEAVDQNPPAGRRSPGGRPAADEWEGFDDRPPRDRYDDDEDLDERPRRDRYDDDEDLDEPDELPSRRGATRRGATRDALAVPARRAGASRSLDLEEDEEYEPRRRTSPLLVVLLVLLALALIFLAWAYTSRVTVIVTPPAGSVREVPFQNEVIPLASGNAASEAAAVQAVPISARAEASAQGQASQQLSPAGVARGSVRLINELEQPIELPPGTEFVAQNNEGQEVRFLIDAPATVPPAVTTNSVTGRSTTFGEVQVQISARSPGSASNVGENAISQLAIPGQGSIQSGGTLRLLNPPIEGGSEALVAVVSEDDVRRVLGEALSRLYQQGVAALEAQDLPDDYVVDAQVVTPSPQQLGDPQSYEQPLVTPPVGQVIEGGDPTFTVSVGANFSALATPRGQPVQDQLGPVVREYIAQRGSIPCNPQDKVGIPVSDWSWDGQRLSIDGAITCTPADGLSNETLGKVQNAVRGQSYEAAVAGLRQLQQAGLIGEYQLPQVEQFPRLDLLLNIQQQRDSTVSQPTNAATTGPRQ